MNDKEIIMIAFYIIELVTIGIFYNLWKQEKKKRIKEKDRWLTLETKYCEKIEELENEIKTHKDMERVVKIEKVTLQPRELECKFMLHERFVDDTELFKKVITTEVARYMAEELNKDPYLCKIYHNRYNYAWREDIKVRFRMLPYAEGVVWEDIFKEEK